MPTFIHDAQKRVVYRLEEPKATPQYSGRNRNPSGWIVTTEVEVTSAVPQIHFATSATIKSQIRSEEFPNPPASSAEIAVGKFLVRGTPRGVQISEAAYTAIRGQYEANFKEGHAANDPGEA
jgi:hypothetical protein